MALRKIATIGHPVLRQSARVLTRDELAGSWGQGLVEDLVATMRDAHGAGLAAPQVYESVRVCVVEVKENPRYLFLPEIPLTILVNPVVTPQTTETFDSYEGCLSVPNLRGVVPRCTEVHVQGWNHHGEPVGFVARGWPAVVYQHEVDHLDGKLFVDRVLDTTTLTTTADYERYHQATFLERMRALVARYGEKSS